MTSKKDNDFDMLEPEYKEQEIRSISPTTDLSKLRLEKIDWDITERHTRYDLYRIHGYAHTTGGRRCVYDYYVCPEGETPSVSNLIAFTSDFAARWGFSVNEVNYTKNKWNQTSIQSRIECTITRNDEEFYTFACNDMMYACAKAQKLIVEIQEMPCPINFNFKNLSEQAVGQRVWYDNEPGIVTRYIDSRVAVFVEPDGIDEFTCPKHWQDDPEIFEEYKNGLVVDLLEDTNILWYRK